LSGTLNFNAGTGSLDFDDAFSVEAALKAGEEVLHGPVYFANGITFNWAVENGTPIKAGEGQQ